MRNCSWSPKLPWQTRAFRPAPPRKFAKSFAPCDSPMISSTPTACMRWIFHGSQKLFCPFSFCFSIVETFQHDEGLFLFAVMADNALEIPAVLNTRQRPARGTEIAQNPRRATTEAWNFFQHRQRAFENILLILLAEARLCVRMKTPLCVRAEFTDDNRLVVFDAPAELVNFIRQAVIPAGVFIETAQVGEFAERIVHNFVIWIIRVGAHFHRGRDQPCAIKRPRLVH